MSTPLDPKDHPSVDLTWSNLRYTVTVTGEDGKPAKKPLLKGVSGTARRCRSLAVMGPSGAGKSTFLNAVAGRLAVNEQQTLEGDAYLNDVLFLARYKPLVSFVAQDDIVMGKDTPREALTFSYRLRSGAPAAEATEAVNAMLERLSLTNCADTLLGIPGLIKGVSGGEKKRTNIGSELINNPMILLLDEPTTGLDSVNALRVGKLLRTLTHEEQRTVICTIHSPSSELYDVFDDVLLLADGHVVYHGATSDAPKYFAAVGHPVPPRVNPSEHFMKVLQLPAEQIAELAAAWRKYTDSAEGRGENLSQHRAPAPADVRLADPEFDRLLNHQVVGAGTELALLTGRAWRTTMRDPAGVFGRLVQTLFFAVLLALFYANLDTTDNGVNDRAGVLFMQVMNLTFMNVMSALAVFPPERAVFLQEQSSSMYSAGLYYVAKVIAELPLNLAYPTLYVIITYFSWDLAPGATAFFNHYAIALAVSYCGNAFGLWAAAMFPSTEIAMTLTPLFLMPMMLVGGLFANTERLEPGWVWLNYISFPRYAYKAFFVNEFTHMDNLCPAGNCRYTSGDEVIKVFGFDKDVVDTVWFNIVMLLVMMLVLRVLGALGLALQGRKTRSRLVFEENYRKGHKNSSDTVEMEPVAATSS
uniref:ABC transporter domain-containing protein n=2 Tax=Neobodo designis TaxID=312471 RepID=A0A7S1MF97_NEODS|mmetsp:Transcript_39571/g.122379  ORF Transcript_39571/g.122379 Transcript_39571/m.122379 type:complete len:642 (+) Transcript_39571:101-2026(+)